MKSLLKTNKGFTLIEILIVLAISGIVISVIGSFFISNYKLFFRVDDQVTVQHEAQSAMHEILYKARVATGFDADQTDNKVKFKMKDENDSTFYLIFEHDQTKKILSYQYEGKKDEESQQIEIGKNIEKFEVKKILDGHEVKGTSITISVQKNDSKVEINDKFYFRNK